MLVLKVVCNKSCTVSYKIYEECENTCYVSGHEATKHPRDGGQAYDFDITEYDGDTKS